MPPLQPITFRFRPEPGRSVERVQLFGEVGDWINPIDLIRTEDGAFERLLPLPAGVYDYKFVVDGDWTIDPSNPRTRSTQGRQNSVLSVGGADEPFLHAPASPYVDEVDRGGVRVVVGVRRGTEGQPIVTWSEDGRGPSQTVPLAPTVEEDEHVLYEARLPVSARRLGYRIALRTAGGDSRAQAFTYAYDARLNAPRWWRDAIVYAIYVDRFRPGRDRLDWHHDPGAGVAAGGDLEGIGRSLDELEELGVTVLYLTPIHRGESSHRYDLVDPLQVDRSLGGGAAFTNLLRGVHERGMRLLLDFSFSHAGVSFPPCRDVLAHGRGSRYADWFLWSAEDTLRHYGRRRDAPMLNLENSEVQALVLQAVDVWAGFGVDGLRLDMAAEVPLDLARRVRARLLHHRPDGVVLGEVVPSHAWRWLEAEAVDASTDFGFHDIVTELCGLGSITPREAMKRFRASELRRGGSSHTALRFASTHDHSRLATIAAHVGAPARAPLGLVLLATMPGVPALLYGEEVGLRALRPHGIREDAWGDRRPMPWTEAARDGELRELVRTLFLARRGSIALREGALEVLHSDERILVLRRSAAGEIVDVYLNVSGVPMELELADDQHPVLSPIVTVGDVVVRGETVTLPPYAALVASRTRTAASVRQRVRLNVVERDQDFERARLETSSTPTRIDFSITERCNLRCEHCITHAPSRTLDGTARTLSPFVLDLLRPWFAGASYFGFVHGGESLTSPALFDVLEAIQRERSGAPYMAHLLSNGILLTESVSTKLVELGVRSISVSLDGATAGTNDAIRTGGRFDAIVERLRRLVVLRREAGWDLRLGISCVVMQPNLPEIPSLVDLAADIGVEWLKLEEGAPVNSFAKRSLVGLDPEGLRAVVRSARERATQKGIVLVDHTFERSIWRCTLDQAPEVRSFVEADEFANRSEVHPCRAPWEVACVDPSGDVRLGHFFGGVLGNVAHAPLADIWNDRRAVRERAASHAARICGAHGPVTCLSTFPLRAL